MSTELWFYGVSPENAYVDLNGSRIHSISVTHVYEIAQTLNKLGLDTDVFLKIFRVYKNEYLKNLSSNEQTELLCNASQFILEPDEINKIRDFCWKAIAKIENAVDIESIWKRIKHVSPEEVVYDYIDKFEVDCFYAWGTLKPLFAFCEKALALGVRLEVV